MCCALNPSHWPGAVRSLHVTEGEPMDTGGRCGVEAGALLLPDSPFIPRISCEEKREGGRPLSSASLLLMGSPSPAMVGSKPRGRAPPGCRQGGWCWQGRWNRQGRPGAPTKEEAPILKAKATPVDRREARGTSDLLKASGPCSDRAGRRSQGPGSVARAARAPQHCLPPKRVHPGGPPPSVATGMGHMEVLEQGLQLDKCM